MSEPISAFAVYRAAAPKGANTSNKSANRKGRGGKNSKNNKNNTSKNKSPEQRDKPKPSAKNRNTAKQNNVSKEKLTPTDSKEVVANKAASKAAQPAQTKNKNDAAKGATTSKKAQSNQQQKAQSKQQQKAHNAVTNGKPVAKGIRESQIDALVEQLLGDSPSKPKKLTKAQQKKKQELEDYLVQQLEKGEEDDSGSEEEESGSEEDYSTGSDEFSDEYTINSYSDEDSEEAEERFGNLLFSSTDSAAESKPVATSTTNATAPKRKSNEGISATAAKAVNGAPQRKKSRQAENAADKRKSMPAPTATPTAAATDKFEKQVEKRRLSVAEVAKVEVKTVDAKTIKMEPLSPPSNIVKMNSIKEGEKVFSWLLSPLTSKEFFNKYWESGACLVRRKGSNYYSHLISFEAIDQMLIKNHVEFTKNIDITSYKNGERETLNPEGRAMPPVVWDHYGQGCSIRLLNPQTFLHELYVLNATMQEYFHCLVGANAYLTPPNSQGFAPHYDDIEAFVLQIEGRKRWRLYKPRTEAEQLPRYSSKNFAQNDIGKPIFDEVLEPGDMLYFPRGTIHQACTEPGYHSLHITLSVYQKQTYADLFERMIPLVLQRAIESNLDMRRGLPLHTFQHAGIAYSDNDTKERAELLRRVTKLMGQCLHSAPLHGMMDAAVDQLAKKYQHEALPPHVLTNERTRTIFGSRSTTNERGECLCDYEIDERTNVRLLRANIMRLVQEEGKVRIYYYLDNSKEYCEYEPNFIEIEAEEAASVEVLIRSYPEYVGVSQLPLADDERKVQMVTALWERGLLMTEKPFK